MNTTFSRPLDFNALGKLQNFSAHTRQHLTRVYSTLAITVLSAAIGSFTYLVTGQFAGILGAIAMFGLLIWANITPKEQVGKRFLLLLGFGFFQGAAVGPLINQVLRVDPAIVTTAFLGTVCVFACFSAASLFATRRSLLYIGGLVSSGLSFLFLASFVNLFIRSTAVFNIQLYVGLLVFCGFVIFDTQLIAEKAESGDKDFVGHALQLFIDFAGIFIRLLIILSKNKGEKKKNSNRR